MVPDIVIHACASAAYAGLAWHFWNTRWREARAAPGGSQGWERAAVLAPLAIHGGLLYVDIFAAPQPHFGFAQALSLMVWLAVAILWVEALAYRIEALYAMALALAAICAPLTAYFPGRFVADADSLAFRVHLLFGILAYSLFTIATLHALLIAAVERRLHVAHDSGQSTENAGLLRGTFSDLPPLLALESVVFRLIGAAFVVLTIAFAIGAAYSESTVGRAMRFDHKTVFIVLSWIAFALLLAGRWLRGWRGRTAMRWTVAGFVMLLLAYPGSRFVLEVILGRA